MPKLPRDSDGLTPQEAHAARLRATGTSQAEAYRQAFNVRRAKPETVWKRASDLFKRPHVQGRVKELLDAAKPADLLSMGAWLDQLKTDIETARADGNHNAVMNGNRLLGQALGALKDNVAVSVEERSADHELVKTIAQGDPAAAAALQRALGAKEGFDA